MMIYGCKVCREIFFFKPERDDHVWDTGHAVFYELDLETPSHFIA